VVGVATATAVPPPPPGATDAALLQAVAHTDEHACGIDTAVEFPETCMCDLVGKRFVYTAADADNADEAPWAGTVHRFSADGDEVFLRPDEANAGLVSVPAVATTLCKCGPEPCTCCTKRKKRHAHGHPHGHALALVHEEAEEEEEAFENVDVDVDVDDDATAEALEETIAQLGLEHLTLEEAKAEIAATAEQEGDVM
jgi:hypothetical protein